VGSSILQRINEGTDVVSVERLSKDWSRYLLRRAVGGRNDVYYRYNDYVFDRCDKVRGQLGEAQFETLKKLLAQRPKKPMKEEETTKSKEKEDDDEQEEQEEEQEEESEKPKSKKKAKSVANTKASAEKNKRKEPPTSGKNDSAKNKKKKSGAK